MILIQLLQQLFSSVIVTSKSFLKMLFQTYKTLPGPKGLPVIGSYFQLDQTRAQHNLTEWSKVFGPIYKFKILGKNVMVLSSSELVRCAFETGALSFYTNDRPSNTTKHIFHGRKHIGFADLNESTTGLRNILQMDLNRYLSNTSHSVSNLECTWEKLKSKFLRNKQKAFDPDIYLKEFLSDLNTVLVSFFTCLSKYAG